ncbi:MAG: aldehyde dehydrogenase family protein [Rhodobacteraceae bacterium]|nr:aldehyde dehydrogenase family protein [Paracoccaceae bacterium]
MHDDLSEKLITHYVRGAWRAPLAVAAGWPVRMACGRVPGQIVPAGTADVARALEAAGLAREALADPARWLAALDAARPAIEAALAAAQRQERGAKGSFAPSPQSVPATARPLAILLPAALGPAAQLDILRGALAAARPVIVKPAPGGAVAATVLMDHLHRLDLPAGAVAMLQGDGPGTGALLQATPGLDVLRLAAS